MILSHKQEQKVALVTGGARRVGAAIVKKLHAAGYKVAIHCNNSLQEAHELAKSCNEQRPDSAFVLQRILNQNMVASQIMETIIDWAGRLDLLVNNASIFLRTNWNTFNESDWDALFTIHVKVPFLLSLAARPLLTKQSGLIVNITDIHAEKPLKEYSIYCQSKAALEMQTKSLALEFAPEIRVNAIAPGAIIWPEKTNSLTLDLQKKIIAKTLLKRHGHPDYIAQAVVAIAENPFITGQIVRIDGGRGLVD